MTGVVQESPRSLRCLPLTRLGTLAVLLAVPLLGGYPQGIVSEILIFAILAMSLDLLMGYTGLMSFGHAAFFGLGAYAVILLNVHMGLNPWLGLAAGVVLSVIAGLVTGALCIRVNGIPFLMLTMALSQLAYGVAIKWRDLTGGGDGIGGMAIPALLGFSLSDPQVKYYVILLFFLFAFLALQRLTHAPLGAVLVGIRENETRMRAIGYPVQEFKLWAIGVASGFAGLAGGLYAFFNGFISPDALSLAASGELLIMVVLGGIGTLFGPVLGAAVFLLAKNILSSHTDHWSLVIGCMFAGCVLFVRGGLVGIARRLTRGEGAQR